MSNLRDIRGARKGPPDPLHVMVAASATPGLVVPQIAATAARWQTTLVLPAHRAKEIGADLLAAGERAQAAKGKR